MERQSMQTLTIDQCNKIIDIDKISRENAEILASKSNDINECINIIKEMLLECSEMHVSYFTEWLKNKEYSLARPQYRRESVKNFLADFSN